MNEAAHDSTASAAATAPPSPHPWVPAPSPAEPGAAEPGEPWPEPDSGSASASAGTDLSGGLGAALAGAGLAGQDRQFIDRLVKRDQQTAASLVSVLWKARIAGRAEAALKPQELETVIGALKDAARYRESGADTMGCRDCENVPGGRCQEHSKDYDKAQACTDLARSLTAARAAIGKGAAGKATAPRTGAGLPQPRGDAGYARPVAS
jgi:hypothetical protein